MPLHALQSAISIVPSTRATVLRCSELVVIVAWQLFVVIGATLMVASFALRMAFVIALGPDLHDVWTYRFFPSTLCFFLFGHLICLASQRWSVLKRPLLGGVLLPCSLAIDRLTAALYAALADPDVRKRLDQVGVITPRTTGSDVLADYLKREIGKWTEILRTNKDGD